jgi:type IV pilus assembly protein PilE
MYWNNIRSTKPNKQSGITLLELMVVVAIIAMISAFAYPSYMDFVVRAKRGAGKSILLQVADRQQQFFMDNKRYATNLTQLGFPANPFFIADDGAFVTSGDGGRLYAVALSNTSATTYTATATPQQNQAAKDTYCVNLTMTHTGTKGQSGASQNCW